MKLVHLSYIIKLPIIFMMYLYSYPPFPLFFDKYIWMILQIFFHDFFFCTNLGDHKKRAKYRFASKTLMRILPAELKGNKHAFKWYAPYALNTSWFWGNTGWNIITSDVVQFRVFLPKKMMNQLIYHYTFIIYSKILVKLHNYEVIFFVTTKISWSQNLKTASILDWILHWSLIIFFAFPL